MRGFVCVAWMNANEKLSLNYQDPVEVPMEIRLPEQRVSLIYPYAVMTIGYSYTFQLLYVSNSIP